MRVPQSHQLFACSSNLPLSLLTGLADGLALKDRATRRTGRDSPQHVGPPLSGLFRRTEIQRKCARQLSKGPENHSPLRFGRPATEPSPRMESPSSHMLRRCRQRWSPEREEAWVSRSPGAWSGAATRSRSPTSMRRRPTRRREQLGDRAWALAARRDRLRGRAGAAADQVVERCGSLDVWVNNAGILITGLAYEQDPPMPPPDARGELRSAR